MNGAKAPQQGRNRVVVDQNESGEKSLNKRQQAKIRTRQKVLDAGRTLFMEGGYAKATIRDIAKGAGMSTGAVFANFEDKADLLLTIGREELQFHQELLERTASEDGTVLDRIVKICTSDFVFFNDRLNLMEALATLETLVEPEKKDSLATSRRAREITLSRRMQVWQPIHDCFDRFGPSGIMRIVAETGLVVGFHLHACREAALQGQDAREYQNGLRRSFARSCAA